VYRGLNNHIDIKNDEEFLNKDAIKFFKKSNNKIVFF